MSRCFAPHCSHFCSLGLSNCSEEHDAAAKAKPIRPVLSVVVEPQAASTASFAIGVIEAGPERVSIRVSGKFTSEKSLEDVNLALGLLVGDAMIAVEMMIYAPARGD